MDHPRPWLRYVDADDLDDKTFDFDSAEVVDPAGEKLGKVDGFVIDVNTGRPYHVAVEAGHWFKHKHFLIPIGHVGLDANAKRLVADVSKDRVERFPGFHRGEFEKLSDTEMEQMAKSIAAACSVETIAVATSWDTWRDYEYPSWWDASFYRPERVDRAARDMAGASPAAGAVGRSSGSTPIPDRSTDARDRDRELVTAQGGDTSPYQGGRAKPGDVIGVETGGETTHVSDTKADEDERRRDAERAAAKDRR
jgi:sporulation protein YlmC with PRC-barrel domain